MNYNEYSVLNILYENDRSLFFRELALASKVSIGGTEQVLKKYSNYIIKKKEGKNVYYTLKKNMNTFYLKLVLEIMKTKQFLSKTPLFDSLIEYLNKNNIPSLIFGSYANKTSKKESDLDLFVISNKKIPDHLCPTSMHIIRMTDSQFKKAVEKKEPLMIEIKNKHIFLNNFDYFVKNLKGEKDG